VFPARIETVAQLRLVRFWIHQLTTKICFHYGGNLYHSKTIGLFFNPSMIEVLFPGQGLHFSINKPQLKLRDGMPFPNLASTFKIGRHMDIDYGGCNQLDSLFIFLSETKHFDCADSCMWEAHIDLSRHDNISELNKIYKIYEVWFSKYLRIDKNYILKMEKLYIIILFIVKIKITKQLMHPMTS
jgi:hypothetical protein